MAVSNTVEVALQTHGCRPSDREGAAVASAGSTGILINSAKQGNCDGSQHTLQVSCLGQEFN